MIFESQHSLKENEFKLSDGLGLHFPLHLHRSFEYFEQIRGSTEVTVGDQSYVLTSGEAVLVFPLQPHSYSTIESGQIRICIFSPDIVMDFYKRNEHRTPCGNKFRCTLPADITPDTIFHQKVLAYFICGEFEKGREYVEQSAKSEHRLLVELLLYAERNVYTSCLLRDAAAELGYDYAYISKIFKRMVKMPFRRYVNTLRVTESKRLLRFSAQSIEEIGSISGFNSLRAFDREFRIQTGMTPTAYRNKHKEQ